LKLLEAAKQALSVPVIGSLNGCSPGGWVRFAKMFEESGADAVELNIYFVPTDPRITSAEVESRYLDLVATVRQSVTIPVAVKIGAQFTNVSNFVGRLAKAGANGVVLFNRYLEPDINLQSLQVTPQLVLSTRHELRLPLRWIAILYERVSASLAATSGIHRGTDALKMLMAGADVTMLCSVLMRHGIDRLRAIEQEMVNWMREHEYESVEQLKGSLSHKNCPDPSAFERAQYMRAIGVQKPA